MQLVKKIIIGAVIGALVGGAVGAYSVYRNRGASQQSDLKVPEKLTATCVGGTKPRIDLRWPAQLDAAVAGFQRSVNGGPWAPLPGGAPAEKKYFFSDTAITPGSTYRYKMTVQNKDVTPIVSVTATEQACTRAQ